MGPGNDRTNSADLAVVARNLTRSLLKARTLSAAEPPVVTLQTIDNETPEKIDTAGITEAIREVLRMSEKIRFADDSKIAVQWLEDARRRQGEGNGAAPENGKLLPGWFRIE